MTHVACIGSRDWTNRVLTFRILKGIQKQFGEITVVSGGARGADSLSAEWAALNDVPCIVFHADWAGLGKKAGVLRNTDIINTSEVVVAFWDGKSTGTMDSIRKALNQQKKVLWVRADGSFIRLTELP